MEVITSPFLTPLNHGKERKEKLRKIRSKKKLRKFGRNDFKEIEHSSLVYQVISYILKYIRKTGEKVIYSKHLQTYFVSDILQSDIVCTIGQENRKLLLFDDFLCIDEGVVMGKVSPDVIKEMPKSN